MNAIAELVRAWDKFELGMEPPPPLDFGKVADEIDRLDGLVREALELLELTHKSAVPGWDGTAQPWSTIGRLREAVGHPQRIA